MKKILLFMFLFLGNITLMAQTVKENNSNNDISYEQALEALEQRKFIVRFNTMDYRAQRRKQLDNETNFLILEGDSASYQYDDGRREYRRNGSVFYAFPKVERGKASDIKINKDKNNNVILSMKVRGKASYSSFKIKIVLESGTNKCIATKTNSSGNSYYTGTLHPIGSTTVMKAN